MTALASQVAADRAVFQFTVPLSAEEFLTLTGIGSMTAAARTHQHAGGWALVDDDGGVWGWHPVDVDDLDWCDAPAALAAFIIDPDMRARLVSDGFRVVADDGRRLRVLLRSQPWYKLPPLPSGLTYRPNEPVLPHWGELLDVALAAVSHYGGAPEIGVAIDDLIRSLHRDFHRPAVFDPTVMRRWLASDDAPAAVTAMRVAAGWATRPSTYAEAIGLLGRAGCTGGPGAQHRLDVHLSDGDWSIGTCRACWRPLLMHESTEQSTVWPMFGDLR